MHWNRKMRRMRRFTEKHVIKLLQEEWRTDRAIQEWLAQRLVDAVGSPRGARCIECEGFWMNSTARKDGRCAGCWLKAAEDAVIWEKKDV